MKAQPSHISATAAQVLLWNTMHNDNCTRRVMRELCYTAMTFVLESLEFVAILNS